MAQVTSTPGAREDRVEAAWRRSGGGGDRSNTWRRWPGIFHHCTYSWTGGRRVWPPAGCCSTHLDDDLQRFVTQVVGEVGADAKGELAAALKALVEPMVRAWSVRRLKIKGLSARIDPVCAHSAAAVSPRRRGRRCRGAHHRTAARNTGSKSRRKALLAVHARQRAMQGRPGTSSPGLKAEHPGCPQAPGPRA